MALTSHLKIHLDCMTFAQTKNMLLGAKGSSQASEASSVRDRVRQWQAQGGGVVDGDVPKDRGTNSPIDPMVRSVNRHSQDADNSEGASKTRDTGLYPAKRVVSDGHWRKPKDSGIAAISRRPTKVRTSTTQSPRSDRIQIDDADIKLDRKRQAKAGRSTVDRTPPMKDNPRALGSASQPRIKIQQVVDGPCYERHLSEPGYNTDDLKRNPRKRLHKEDDPRRVRSTNRDLEVANGVPAAIVSIHDRHTDSEENEFPVRGGRSEIMSKQRSQKGRSMSQALGDTRKALARCTLEAAPILEVPSIEHWLDSTSDPIVTPEEFSAVQSIPLHPSTREQAITTPVSTKAGKMPLSASVGSSECVMLDTKEGTRRVVTRSKRRRRIPSSAIYQGNPFPADFDADFGASHAAQGSETASKLVDLVQDSPQDSLVSINMDTAHGTLVSPKRDRPPYSYSRRSLGSNDACGVVHTADTLVDPGIDPVDVFSGPPGLAFKRPFPSTGGHQLSTIASVETLNSTNQHRIRTLTGHKVKATMDSTLSMSDDVVDEKPGQNMPSLSVDKNALTKHADLMSVLSYPVDDKANRSAHCIRMSQSHVGSNTVRDLMCGLATEEAKYIQELQILVDGVIPVLLSCVLSKADSTVAAALFQRTSSASAYSNFTRPIVEMGIVLERLRTLHKRIPKEDLAAFLTWAHGAQRVYGEYLKAWRLGFQDVVVTLAPGSHSTQAKTQENQSIREELPRNGDGDVINGEGRRVDVAFLLKRPLVRLKYLAKTLKGIDAVEPSTEASILSVRYQCLVVDARNRSYEERARLEDEAAANIDSTRCRDPQTLAPVVGVTIDRSRRVRARDHFNLSLHHSSGQRIDCRVELLLRDEATTGTRGGDLLICEIDTTGRWLLFPPIPCDLVSARDGDLREEIIIMIRGMATNGKQWQEVISLVSEEDTAGVEWIHMLGLTPVPPRMIRSQSFVSRHPNGRDSLAIVTSIMSHSEISPGVHRPPTPIAVEVPIGERTTFPPEADIGPIMTSHGEVIGDSSRVSPVAHKQAQDEDLGSTMSIQRHVSTSHGRHLYDFSSSPRHIQSDDLISSKSSPAPRTFKEALGLSGSSNLMGLHRSKANRTPRYSMQISQSRIIAQDKKTGRPSRGFSAVHDWKMLKSSNTILNEQDKESFRAHPVSGIRQTVGREDQLSTSSSTSMTHDGNVESGKSTFLDNQLNSFGKEVAEPRRRSDEYGPSPEYGPTSDSSRGHTRSVPSSAKSDSARRQYGRENIREQRPSSPLKHQYEPSSASKTSSDSELSTAGLNEATSVSDSSANEGLENEDESTKLLPLAGFENISRSGPKSPISAASLKPSDSASQVPYQSAPAEQAKACKTIASIFSWSDEGFWQSLHPDECSVVVTPGLIEAFEMSAAHSNVETPTLGAPATAIIPARSYPDLSAISNGNESQNEPPLVALELTPLVPLRRGTAIDISIRSPPIPASRLRSGNNVMFRSRNPEECEALYALINHSRIHNPTFLALQHGRTPYDDLNTARGRARRQYQDAPGDARSSWFGGWGRSSSYRASSGRARSLGLSDTSVGSLSSAFSALKRFSTRNGNGAFNIAKSTIGSRTMSQENSVYASSEKSSGSGTNTPIVPDVFKGGRNDDQIGLTNAIIRLYIRETASKWRDMGAARLTIMKAQGELSNPEARLGGCESPTGYSSHGKRIVVHGKTKGEVLLDAQLGESCFERVARTGIALSVWEDVIGPNGEVGVVNAIGGVAGGRAKVYMIQVIHAFRYLSSSLFYTC